MHTKQIQIPVAGRRRGRYTEAFKTQVVTAARQPGVSTAAVALANGLNASLLRRWIPESAAQHPKASSTSNPSAQAPRYLTAPWHGWSTSLVQSTPTPLTCLPTSAPIAPRPTCTPTPGAGAAQTRMAMYEVVVGGFALFSVADY